MVSPSKIFKKSNNRFKVAIVSTKKNGLKTREGSQQGIYSSSQSAHPQFLSNIQFYLDIRNRKESDKVETILKSYGAKIEIFFKRSIKVIVTDKPEWIRNTCNPSSSISPLTTPSPSTNQDQRFTLPKSRASAMLEKLSQQPTSSYNSPLELAQKWRIPVLPVRNLWQWIAKAEEAFITKSNEKKKEKFQESKIIVCARDKAPFIKIESIVSQNKPEFSELEVWPSLNLDGRLGQCPFQFPSSPSSTISNDLPQEVENNLFKVKNSVAVEVIQYDTDFRIQSNKKPGECEEKENKIAEVTMTRRPVKSNAFNNDEEASKVADSKHNLSPICNGLTSRNITRQSSQELLKVQCNGLTSSHRNSKLLSPSGSDVLPLPSCRRSTRRASASWCGSTRELSQLSPTDSEIENIRRSGSSFETHDSGFDATGITLRPKGQLWLPIALIGTTAEENGNCIRKRLEYSIRQSENVKFSCDSLDSYDEKLLYDGNELNEVISSMSKESDSTSNLNCSQNEMNIKPNPDKKEAYCIVTRNTKIKNEEINGSRESSIESCKSNSNDHKNRIEYKKRCLSVSDKVSPIKRNRTMSANSVQSLGRRKKLSPEEKLLQDNKEYFKMEVFSTKLRSTGSLINLNQKKKVEVGYENTKPFNNVNKIIIKKINTRGRKRRKRRIKSKTKEACKFNHSSALVQNKKSGEVKINGVIRKKRQSELIKLCNEAESFMFGESSRQSAVISNINERESEEALDKRTDFINLNKTNNFDKTNTNNNYENDYKSKKKRRSHAEAFIHDNLDYYKFETPGSRLRYQGNIIDTKCEDKDFIYPLKNKKKEIDKKNEAFEKLPVQSEETDKTIDNQEKKKNCAKPSEKIQKILFSFESIPATEPWYEVYKRQDEGMENYYPLLSNPSDQPFLLPYELPKPIYSKVPAVNEYFKKRRKKLVHLFNHPRKSPRCHASTLAILSSLKKRKRRSGTNISMNSLLSESPVNNLCLSEEKFGSKFSETENKSSENEEILNFLYNDELDVKDNEILLEPFSDCEITPLRKNSDFCKSVKSDEEQKNYKSIYRSKTNTKSDSLSESEISNKECKQFSWQIINPDEFFKDMVIKTQKRSGLIDSILTVLDNYKKCRSMEDPDADFANNVNDSNASETLGKTIRRKRRKGRKINKTGWDNKKSRRRSGPKMGKVKDLECSEVKENIKTKVKIRENGINSDNIIIDTVKRRLRKSDCVKKNSKYDDKPLLRSHIEISGSSVNLRRNSRDIENKSSVIDLCNQEHSHCVLRFKKIPDSSTNINLRLRCSPGRHTLQRKRLVINRKKRVIDYAWNSKKR